MITVVSKTANILYVSNISVQDINKMGKVLLEYSRQVVSAMVYLSTRGFIHRDLAARNILVSKEGICKVSIMVVNSL